jgi:ribosomal RNA-processing protein 17
MPPKRKLDSRGAPRVEEITFDRDARKEYLTGFHKRKLQRIKHAKETAAAIEKQAKQDARKQVSFPLFIPLHALLSAAPR